MQQSILDELKKFMGETTITPIVTGGSTREFYRVSSKSGSIILSIGKDRKEFEYYTELAELFHKEGVFVPKFLKCLPEYLAVFMEDLGELSLYEFSKKEPSKLREPYLQVIEQILILQDSPAIQASRAADRVFDLDYLLWESTYFTEHFFNTFLHRSELVTPELKMELYHLAERVKEIPARVLHRDLQSQNVILNSGRPFLIDFQGARRGPIFYDPASLILDPYVALNEGLRTELLDCYISAVLKRGFSNSREELTEQFYETATQRIMQAIGAYGNLGVNKGKLQFLQYIPMALERLRWISERASLKELSKVLRYLN